MKRFLFIASFQLLCMLIASAQTIAESPQQRKTFVYLRGDYRQRGIAVQPATPAVLPALPDSAEPARLRLARWLVSRENPLTSRVIVNRIWQELFGQGIVTTSEDLGSQGTKRRLDLIEPG